MLPNQHRIDRQPGRLRCRREAVIKASRRERSDKRARLQHIVEQGPQVGREGNACPISLLTVHAEFEWRIGNHRIEPNALLSV